MASRYMNAAEKGVTQAVTPRPARVWYNRPALRQDGLAFERVRGAGKKGATMFGIVFKLFGFAVVIVAIVYMAASAFRNARRLDRRIEAFKAEQEALKQQGVIINPYAAMAELYADESQRAAEQELRQAANARKRGSV